MLQLSIDAWPVVKHGDLSHKMTLSHEGPRPECDNDPCVTKIIKCDKSNVILPSCNK